MKLYRLIDNFELWGREATQETYITEKALDALSHEWGKDKEELLKDLEEIYVESWQDLR